MADHSEPHAEPVNDEFPSQGVFMGYLALALAVFAIAAAVLAFIAAATHTG